MAGCLSDMLAYIHNNKRMKELGSISGSIYGLSCCSYMGNKEAGKWPLARENLYPLLGGSVHLLQCLRHLLSYCEEKHDGTGFP